MNDINLLHEKAMALAEEASLARLRGDVERATRLLREALSHEKNAADQLVHEATLEPTRSILHRSAASLAFECGEYREAERLVALGLSGDPPEVIADELRDLLEQIHLGRHLRLRGLTLSSEEFQFSITGDSVGHGVAESERFIARVQDLEKLIYRTAERKADKPYRDRGRRDSSLARDVTVFITVPRAASFAVSFRLGYGEQLSLPGIGKAEAVVDELFACLALFNGLMFGGLKEKIPDETYYRNFLALAKRIAPDGRAIRSVGFTMVRAGQESRVLLSTPTSEIPEIVPLEVPTQPTNVVRVRGTLKYADARREEGAEIRLIEGSGKAHRVRVAPGLMDDIVRPLWDYEVVVTGSRKGSIINLEDIKKVEDEGV